MKPILPIADFVADLRSGHPPTAAAAAALPRYDELLRGG